MVSPQLRATPSATRRATQSNIGAVVLLFGSVHLAHCSSPQSASSDVGADIGSDTFTTDETDSGVADDSEIRDGTAKPETALADTAPDVEEAATDGGSDVEIPDVADSGLCGTKTCAVGTHCSAGLCEGLSCGVTGLDCSGTSCCASNVVAAGSYRMGRDTTGVEDTVCSTWAKPCLKNDQPEHSATVDSFRLDTFEISVGRYRNFVTAIAAGWVPTPGDGAHPVIGARSGWQKGWTVQSNAASPKSCGSSVTWTDSPAENEHKPINCLDWYTAFAFCIWDGGRLPTEAEWELAASGGEGRPLPWVTDTTPPDCTFANYGACLPSTLAEVGKTKLGVGKYGQHDLAGNVEEWVLDEWATYTTAECKNCANTAFGTFRVTRGGDFAAEATYIRTTNRFSYTPVNRYRNVGARCARPL